MLSIKRTDQDKVLVAQKHFFWLYCHTTLYQYLFCNTIGRRDGAGKAHNHLELTYSIIAIIEQIDKDDANVHGGDDTWTCDKLVHGNARDIDNPFLTGCFMYQFVHDHTQQITNNLDTIGLTRDNYRPDYDIIAPIFADKFFDLAVEAIGFWHEAVKNKKKS